MVSCKLGAVIKNLPSNKWQQKIICQVAHLTTSACTHSWDLCTDGSFHEILPVTIMSSGCENCVSKGDRAHFNPPTTEFGSDAFSVEKSPHRFVLFDKSTSFSSLPDRKLFCKRVSLLIGFDPYVHDKGLQQIWLVRKILWQSRRIDNRRWNHQMFPH